MRNEFVAVVVALVAAVLVLPSQEVLARGGGGGGGGGGFRGGGFGGGGHVVFGGGFRGSGFRSRGFHHFVGSLYPGRFGRVGPFERGFGFYGGYPYGYSCDFDQCSSPTVVTEEQPSYSTAAYPYVRPPRLGCITQNYRVPSESGGQASINVVRC
jgi:hypothetical protein